ncbi:MAG TPA: hypothetical protein VI039_10280 [Solirubrobacterales bacterium]
MAYFINLYTEETWRESRENARWQVSGHTERLRNRDRIEEGDVLLCWVTKVSAFVGAMRVTGPAVEVGPEGERIWRKKLFPVRFPVELLVRVPVEEGVSLPSIREHSQDPSYWRWIFRNSGNRIPDPDAEWILSSLRERPQLVPLDPEPVASRPQEEAESRRDTGHGRVQLQLALLAKNAGLDIWIARNDRSRQVDGYRLGDLSVESLPDGLPADARNTIELIDVVWLKRNRYVAAFEVEASTPVFTGLQRMGDLMAAIPNMKIPLFVAAPESKREKVFSEITRPLFRFGLDPPLEETCRYIPFEVLTEAFEKYGGSTSIDAERLVDELSESAQ